MHKIFAAVFFAGAASAAAASPMSIYWRGASDSSAANADNWADANGDPAGRAPETGDSVVVDSGAADRDMIWDLDDVVPVNWSQSGFNGTVYFQTGETGVTANSSEVVVHGALSGDGKVRLLKLTGDLLLQSGVWQGWNNPSFAAGDAARVNGRGAYRLVIDVAGDATVSAGAAISVVSNGFYYCQGPAVGLSSGGAGGSHGGRGYGYVETKGSHRPGHCYGSICSPETLGSSGGEINNASLPGGALRLVVGGVLTLDGTLTAKPGVKNRSGGVSTRACGSGGSVWVTAASIAGGGLISADGAGGSSFGSSAGGRVSVQLTGHAALFSSFSGSVTAYGGYYSNNNYGLPGTIYIEDASNRDDGGDLIVKGSRNSAYIATYQRHGVEIWPGMTETNRQFASVTVTNGANFAVGAGCSLKTRKLLGSDNSKDWVMLEGGSLDVVGDEPIEKISVRNLFAGSTVAMPTLRIGNGAVFYPDWPMTITNVVVGAGATISHTANGDTDLGYRVDLDVPGDFTVESGGVVSVAGKGFSATRGPGAPQVSNCCSSHGGRNSEANSLGVCYGDPKHPVEIGSGSSHTAGSGAIRLAVGGILAVGGSVSAKGNDQTGYPAAGGSVWITAGRLVGSGEIRANGGKVTTVAAAFPGAPGGGRIAVTVTNEGARVSDFTGVITACGGCGVKSVSTLPYGGAGTVYLRDFDQGDDDGVLIIDNANSVKTNSFTVFSSSVSNCTVGCVVITNRAKLLVESDRVLTVRGDWTSLGATPTRLGAAAGGTALAGRVTFAGSGVSTVRGTNFFADVFCETPGKTIVFSAADDTYTRVDGVFAVTGEKNSKIALRSTATGEPWRLEIAGDASVFAADVCDSDASFGKRVVATSSSGADARNVNWTFLSDIEPGEVITWQGDGDTGDWSDADNWDRSRVPAATDEIVIPAGCARYPALVSAGSFYRLSVAAGASLDLAGFDLAVSNAFVCAGTLTAHGSETVTLFGDSSFAGAAVPVPPATVTVAGADPQTVDFGALAFNEIILANTGSGAALDGGFTARRLSCVTAAARTYAFAAGATFAVDEDLVLDGSAGGAAALSLVSGTTGEAWRLRSAGLTRVAGVSVADSDASSGRRVTAFAPSSGTRCVNWMFGVASVVWTGAGGDSYFTNAANWSSGAVPGASARIVFDGAATVDVDGGAAVLAVSAENGAAAVITGEPSLTVGDVFEILDGATVSLDSPVIVSNAVTVRRGGTLTHPGNGKWDGVTDPNDLSKLKRIVLDVGGEFIVEAGGLVTADGKGFPGGVVMNNASGPGYGKDCINGVHAGRVSANCATYGSPFQPSAPGSACNQEGCNGGGAIRINAGGRMRIDGSVSAKGVLASGCQSYTGAGGSIWITCAELVGSGLVSVEGAPMLVNYPGCGGRIAVYQTEAVNFDGWRGSTVAWGGRNWTQVGSLPRSAAGTVYFESAGGVGKKLVVDNDGGTVAGTLTDLMPTNWCSATVKDLGEIELEVNGARANLLRSAKMVDFELDGRSTLYLNGNVLELTSRNHCNAQTRAGVYSPTWPGTVETEGGRIVWYFGLMLFLR
ncbi:MAG: hypothetical protein J6T01_03850 [Kiritimatiellae bacterium]|nr:hypothetical protein [Kiritimatiellia bacterium]